MISGRLRGVPSRPHIQSLEAGINTIAYHLSLPIEEKGNQAGAGRLPQRTGVVFLRPGACRSFKTG